jgi:hypothetical protein
MVQVLGWLGGLCLGLGSLVCFIIVIAQMMKRGHTGLGVLCLVLGLCGIGELAAFIIGWSRARLWHLTGVMIAWSVLIVAGIAFYLAAYAISPDNPRALEQEPAPYGAQQSDTPAWVTTQV